MNWNLFIMFVVLLGGTVFVLNLDSNKNVNEGVSWYVYKYNDLGSYDYVAGFKDSEQNISFPINFNEQKLTKGFFLNNGSFDKKTILSNSYILNLKKEILNQTWGYPGCYESLIQAHPNCFGHDFVIRHGTNIVCDELTDREANPRTSFCPVYNETPDILYTEIYEEFFYCDSLPFDIEYMDSSDFVILTNQIINSGELENFCVKLK
jgi:hypothetical protein